jgi:hypothetical protein
MEAEHPVKLLHNDNTSSLNINGTRPALTFVIGKPNALAIR